MGSTSNRLLQWISLVTSLVGVGAAAYGVRKVLHANESHEWPSVKGTVLSSKVVTDEAVDGLHHRPSVHFEYRIGRRRFEGDEVGFDPGGMSYAQAHRAVADRFSDGAEVEVFYNPQDEYEAVLEPGAKPRSYTPVWIGLGLALLGIVGLWWASGRSRG